MRTAFHCNNICFGQLDWYLIKIQFLTILCLSLQITYASLSFKNKEKKSVCLIFCFVFAYGIDLLYSFPSNASLYISATYGFFPGVSAPNSTKRAYTLTTYARAPMKATTTPILNIQWLGTAKISSTNQKCHISFTPIVNMVAR